ncbi:MAG: hypothetical protein ABUT20_45515, partial [Bacteroidota bacterium]
MVDVTRNLLQVRKNDQLFSVAEYFDSKIQKRLEELFFIRVDSTPVYGIYKSAKNDLVDKYFNDDHFLRYYYTMDLSQVYAPISKIKRYFLASPWYEIYMPQKHHFNFLFRIKQFFLFGIAMIIIAMVAYKIKTRKKKI